MRGTIRLAEERTEQLRRLAAHHGKHVTELIEDWIADEWQRLGYDPVLPKGFDSEALDEAGTSARVRLHADGLEPVDLEHDEAREVALGLIALADGDQSAPTRIDATRNGGHLVEIRRQGKGIGYLVNGRKKGLTYGLARDLGYAVGQQIGEFGVKGQGPTNADLNEYTNSGTEQPPEWGSW